jgi:hypothetical protein
VLVENQNYGSWTHESKILAATAELNKGVNDELVTPVDWVGKFACCRHVMGFEEDKIREQPICLRKEA